MGDFPGDDGEGNQELLRSDSLHEGFVRVLARGSCSRKVHDSGFCLLLCVSFSSLQC